jgi:hypothetical protein
MMTGTTTGAPTAPQGQPTPAQNPAGQQQPGKQAPPQAAQPQTPEEPEQFFSDDELKAIVKKKLKLKVNGGEDDAVALEQLIADRQKYIGSEKKFDEAHKIRQEAQTRLQEIETKYNGALQFLQESVKNPLLFFKQAQVNPREWAETFLKGQIEWEMMSPEQRQQIQIQRENERLRRQVEGQTKKQEDEKFEQSKSEARQRFETGIISALDKGGIPKNERSVMRMAQYMRAAADRGEDASPERFIERVRGDYAEDLRSLYGALEGEKLIEAMGEDVTEKIRKADLARVRHAQPPTPPSQRVVPAQQSNEKRKFLSEKDWRRDIERSAGLRR